MKAAYYARVSTEEERQLNALSKQCKDLSDCIAKNKWEEIDQYVDEGKSGTQTKRRDEYNRLFDDLSTDKWDILVIKSQDRLMRNVKDWYIFISELVSNNKKLFIYMDNSFYKPDDAMILGIKAILAEEYSRDLSRKLNNAHKRRAKEGSSVMSNNKILGYYKQKGELVIDENEAKIVRRIFEMYVNEKRGIREIINQLAEEGFYTEKGKKFGTTTINRILQNEKYMGTMICNKAHKDFETKKVIKNDKSEWIIHENRVPKIISKEMFDEAQRIRASRRQIYSPNGYKVGKKETKHPLGGKIFCGYCGKVMWFSAVKKTFKKSERIEYRYPWMCSTFVQYGRLGQGRYKNEGCNKKNINDAYLTDGIINFIKMFNSSTTLTERFEDYINNIKKSIDNTCDKINIELLTNQINNIEHKRSILVDKFLDGTIPEDIYKRKNNELEQELINKKIQLENANNQNDEKNNLANKLERIKNVCRVIDESINIEETYSMFCELISKIITYDDKIEIYLFLSEDYCYVINKPLGFITNTFKKTQYNYLITK